LETRAHPRLTAAEGRTFGLTVGAAFVGLAGLLWWRGHPAAAVIAGGVGAALVVAGLAIPARLGPVRAAWMVFAELLSKVTTPIFMGLVYFLVLTPAGVLMRMAGRNPLVRERDGSGFWIRRERVRSQDMRRQF
jgi:hypothetical protein